MPSQDCTKSLATECNPSCPVKPINALLQAALHTLHANLELVQLLRALGSK